MCGRPLRALLHVIQGLGVSLFIFSLASHTAGVLTVTTHRNSITTVILYTYYINRHERTPKPKQRQKDTMNLDTAQFWYMGSGIGWMYVSMYRHHI